MPDPFNQQDVLQHRGEINTILHGELQQISRGHFNEVILMKSLAKGVPLPHLQRVLHWRGKRWQFVSALADKMVEARGAGLLRYVSVAVGNDIALAMVLDVAETVARLEQFKALYGHLPGLEPFIKDLRQQTIEAAKHALQAYWADIENWGRLT